MDRVSATLLAAPFFLFAAQSAAAPDPQFDQGVDVRPVIEQSRQGAGLRGRGLAAGQKSAGDADGPVWISVSNEDVAALGDEFDFPRRVPLAQGGIAAVFEVKVSELDLLAAVMQRRLHKSPGFFAHASLEAAQRDIEAAPAAMTKAYTIDQREVVAPMLQRVDEAAISGVIGRLSSYKNRYYRSETGVASSRWVRDRWQELAAGRSDITVTTYGHGGFAQESVILTVRGAAEPDQVVVLGGHLDSIAGGGGDNAAPGADDNASGVAVLTEAIRVMVASGYKPKATLKFIAYAAEEVGLRGSREIADRFKKDGVAVQGVVNFDMANYKGSSEDIYLISDNTHEAQNAFLGRLVETYTDYRWAKTKCGYGCSDHVSWTRDGFIASFPFETMMNEDNPNIHSDKDTLAQTGGRSLQAFKFAKLAVAYLVEMAK